jgi:hypothetical protein
MFWKCPNSCERSGSVQYRSIIFYGNEEQKKTALASRERESKNQGRAIDTPILPLESFTLAEDYHQKFFLRQYDDLATEFSDVYPDLKEFTNSTAAMKLNMYLGGHGMRKMLNKEIDRLGLSDAGKKRLQELVGNTSEYKGAGR